MSERLWERSRPISARPNEVYNFENTEFYDVAGAVSAINANPENFHFAIVRAAQVPPLLEGQVDLDMAEVSAISREDAERPVLIGMTSQGQHRLLDGYKRARRAIMLGAPGLGAWVLSPEQTKHFRLSTEAAANVPRINLG